MFDEGLLIMKDGREFQYVTMSKKKERKMVTIFVIGTSRIRLWGCLGEGEG